MSTARSTEMLNVQCLFGRSSQKSATGYNWAYRLLLVVRGPPWRMYVCMYVCMYDYIAVPVGHTLWHEVCAFLARATLGRTFRRDRTLTRPIHISHRGMASRDTLADVSKINT